MGKRLSQPQIPMLSPADSSCIGSPRFTLMFVSSTVLTLVGVEDFVPQKGFSLPQA